MKRETGGNPVRSRHCDREFSAEMSLRKREDAENDELKSGDLLELGRVILTVYGMSFMFWSALYRYTPEGVFFLH